MIKLRHEYNYKYDHSYDFYKNYPVNLRFINMIRFMYIFK